MLFLQTMVSYERAKDRKRDVRKRGRGVVGKGRVGVCVGDDSPAVWFEGVD